MIQQHNYGQVELSVFQLSKIKHQACGDSYFSVETDDYFICAIADGLGSGDAAKKASGTAMEIIQAHHSEEIDVLMEMCNQGLRDTRGAVLTIFKLEYKTCMLYFSGVGNIRMIMSSPSGSIRQPIPKSGYLCGRPQRFNVQQFQYEKDSLFMIFSDGLKVTSANRQMIFRIGSPHDAVHFIKNSMSSVSDDTTCIIGKIN
jgi:negative regulator of sigma-B (phosphoserine phosphatase)